MQGSMLQRPKGDTFYINTIVILMGCGASDCGGGDTCDGLQYI